MQPAFAGCFYLRKAPVATQDGCGVKNSCNTRLTAFFFMLSASVPSSNIVVSLTCTYRVYTSFAMVNPSYISKNFFSPIHKVVMPGFLSVAYPFHPPNLAITHVAYRRDDFG